MTIEKYSGEAYRLWLETAGADVPRGDTDGTDIDDSDWQNYINSSPTREEFTHAFNTGDGNVTVCYSGISYWGYGLEEPFRSCGIYSEADWKLFTDTQLGGGGMSCEQLRECTIDFIDETPLIADEEMPRDDEDFLLWKYTPPTTYNELLEEPIDIPFRRLADIVAILQVMQYQLNELIVIQRSEVVGGAFPEWNQVRIENNRPVGIFQACELLRNGKLSGAHYQIQIPHMRDDPDIFPPQVFWYLSGNIQYLRLFPDNSRMIVMTRTVQEGKRILDTLTGLMQPEKVGLFIDKPTPLPEGTFEERYKILKYLSYYPGGVKGARAKWSRLTIDPAQYYLPSGFTPE